MLRRRAAPSTMLRSILPTLVLISVVGCCNAKEMISHASVIVVGAGLSGVMAAKTLSDNGVKDILILEATEKIGGRIRRTSFAGHTVELGANWVEGVGGEHQNPIWTLANQYKMRTFYTDQSNVSFNIYSQEGELLPQSVVARPFKLADASSEYGIKLSESMDTHGEQDISILCAQRAFGHVPSSPLEMVIDFFNYDYETAEPPRVTSLLSVQPFPTFKYFGDDSYFVADSRGYAFIVENLAREFLHHDGGNITDSRLKLNKVVRLVEHSSHGVRVTTEDGSIYSAKYAIISVSLGVLQSKLIQYKPDLPMWKLRAFFQFDMAIYTKIFMKFPKRFWPVGPGTEFFLYAHEKRGYYPVWQHLEGEYPGSNILFVTVTDDESRRIEQQTDEETKAEAMEVLRKIFGKGIPEAESILVPRWWKNRFFGGTFTNWPIGVIDANFDTMKAPVDNVYFTGEHTSEKFNGYVHGAYLAGIATAKTLLDCIHNQKCGELTADGYPGEPTHKDKGCKGACCAEVEKERELVRQAWIKKVNTMEAFASKSSCKP